MGFPKKGTRRIVVSGRPFLWRVAVDEDWKNPLPPNPTDLHTLAVESPEHPGRYLSVRFALPEEHTGLGFAITPAIVAEVIKAAMIQGWPEVDGPWRRTWRHGRLDENRRGAAHRNAAEI